MNQALYAHTNNKRKMKKKSVSVAAKAPNTHKKKIFNRASDNFQYASFLIVG
jgi:hypothetical protein